ncbi:hypothetical protein GGR92_004577 [Spirosoma lacussanchae]|uniref:hypothetical protein n=1 Tax=Spirosoma lacussanchae TaxID=1884249 RepID=UPI001109CF21|nr:hypothetical protein [Spirosoma lacussanchae]
MERLLELAEKYPLDFVSHLSSGLPIFIGILTFRYHSVVRRYIWLLFIFFFCKDSLSLYHTYRVTSNLYVQNADAFFSTLFIALIYYNCFSNRLPRQLIIYSCALAIGVIVLTYNNERVSFMNLLAFRFFAIGLSLSYFNKIIQDLRIKHILKHTMFWFSSGLLIYATGTFFVSLFIEFLFDPSQVDDATFDSYWNLNNSLFVIFSVLSAVGLWFSRGDRENMV